MASTLPHCLIFPQTVCTVSLFVITESAEGAGGAESSNQFSAQMGLGAVRKVRHARGERVREGFLGPMAVPVFKPEPTTFSNQDPRHPPFSNQNNAPVTFIGHAKSTA